VHVFAILGLRELLLPSCNRVTDLQWRAIGSTREEEKALRPPSSKHFKSNASLAPFVLSTWFDGQ
jgi:hypothetical protein